MNSINTYLDGITLRIILKSLRKVSIVLITTGILLEISSRIIYPQNRRVKETFMEEYTKTERDKTIPFIRRENGGDCIDIKSPVWNPWWGWNRKFLDRECAKRLFAETPKSVVFLGGSAMFNVEAPNYLTHIDYYATKDIKNIVSINLAEGGARHKNQSNRFQRQVLPLKPDIVIFLDGFNEFNSVRRGGEPNDDFFWTANVKKRLIHPWTFYLEKFIAKSRFIETALVRTGIYNSPLRSKGRIAEKSIIESANVFLQDIEVTKAICTIYNIKCIFIIQPVIFNSSILEHKRIIDQTNYETSNYADAYLLGYKRILEKCDYCIDASKILDNKEKTYIDAVHFSKRGSKIVGDFLRNIIEENTMNSSEN